MRAQVLEGPPVALLIAPQHQVPPQDGDGVWPAGVHVVRRQDRVPLMCPVEVFSGLIHLQTQVQCRTCEDAHQAGQKTA